MQITNLDDLSKLIEVCRKKGVKSLKLGEFQIELDSEALFPESAYKRNKKDKEPDISNPNSVAEADLVQFWSSGLPGAQ